MLIQRAGTGTVDGCCKGGNVDKALSLECEIKYVTILEEVLCYEWVSESKEMRADTEDFQRKTVAGCSASSQGISA